MKFLVVTKILTVFLNYYMKRLHIFYVGLTGFAVGGLRTAETCRQVQASCNKHLVLACVVF